MEYLLVHRRGPTFWRELLFDGDGSADGASVRADRRTWKTPEKSANWRYRPVGVMTVMVGLGRPSVGGAVGNVDTPARHAPGLSQAKRSACLENHQLFHPCSYPHRTVLHQDNHQRQSPNHRAGSPFIQPPEPDTAPVYGGVAGIPDGTELQRGQRERLPRTGVTVRDMVRGARADVRAAGQPGSLKAISATCMATAKPTDTRWRSAVRRAG